MISGIKNGGIKIFALKKIFALIKFLRRVEEDDNGDSERVYIKGISG